MVLLLLAYVLHLAVTRVSEMVPALLTAGVVTSFLASVILYIKGAYAEKWKLNPNAITSKIFISR